MLLQMAESHSLLWPSDIPLYVYDMFIYSSVEGRLYCFHILTIVNNAIMSIGVPVSFQISAFGFFRYILAVKLLGNIVVLPLFFSEEFHIVFHSGCTRLQFSQQCTWVPFCWHPSQDLLFVEFLIIVIWWYLLVVLICISLMINNVEHFFHVPVSLLEKCLFRSLAHFLSGLFVCFWCWVVWTVYIF